MQTDFFKIISPLLLAASFAVTTPAFAESFAYFDTMDNSELLSTIPGDGSPHVLFSKNIGDLSPHQILQVLTEFEATNDTANTALLGAQLILGADAGSTTGTPLAAANGKNITPNGSMHHGVRVKGAIMQFDSGTSGVPCLNLVVWSNKTLSVPLSRGRMQGVIITP